MFGIVSQFKLAIASGIALVSLSAVCWGLYNAKEVAQARLGIEVAQRAATEAALVSSNAFIEDLNQRIILAKKESVQYQEEVSKIKVDYSELQGKFESHKGREAAILRKPQVVNKLINRSFNQLIDKVSCNSGDLTKCIE